MELGAVGHELEVDGNDSSCYKGWDDTQQCGSKEGTCQAVPACKGSAREGERRKRLCLIREIYAHSMLKGNEGSTGENCRPGCGAWEKENRL